MEFYRSSEKQAKKNKISGHPCMISVWRVFFFSPHLMLPEGKKKTNIIFFLTKLTFSSDFVTCRSAGEKSFWLSAVKVFKKSFQVNTNFPFIAAARKISFLYHYCIFFFSTPPGPGWSPGRALCCMSSPTLSAPFPVHLLSNKDH